MGRFSTRCVSPPPLPTPSVTVSLGGGGGGIGGRNISVELGASEWRGLHINKKCVSQVCLSIYGPVECVTESSCFRFFYLSFFFFLLLSFTLPKKTIFSASVFLGSSSISAQLPHQHLKPPVPSHAWIPPLNVTVRCHKPEEICHEAYFPMAPTPPLKTALSSLP